MSFDLETPLLGICLEESMLNYRRLYTETVPGLLHVIADIIENNLTAEELEVG